MTAHPHRAFNQVRDLPLLIFTFLRDPVGTMKHPSRLSWPAAFTLQVGAAALSGMVAGLISGNWLDAVVGLFVFPLITVMISAIFTLFIYQFFAYAVTTALDIRRIHSIVVIATVPYFISHSMSGFLAPLDLIGFALAMILLTVGLVEQFGLRKQTVMTLAGALFAAFFVVWSLVQALTA